MHRSGVLKGASDDEARGSQYAEKERDIAYKKGEYTLWVQINVLLRQRSPLFFTSAASISRGIGQTLSDGLVCVSAWVQASLSLFPRPQQG